MINEWEEFCAYTGTVSYTASKKSDTTWLGRFTFATILEFEGMARILTILARGYLFHGNCLLRVTMQPTAMRNASHPASVNLHRTPGGKRF